MPKDTTVGATGRERRSAARAYIVWYAALTAAVFAPLLWSFASLRSLYPAAAWTVMTSGGESRREYTYYVLRGETADGRVSDLRAAELTNALSAVNWGMVSATARNASLRLDSPHPANARLLASSGGADALPGGARMPELLKAWGEIYNSRLAEGSADRLKAVRLDSYRWDGAYGFYERYAGSWRAEL